MRPEQDVKTPGAVAEPKHPGEAEAKPPWVEASVWTERMWTALQSGVGGGKWYSLIDKLCKRANLESAYEKVARNKGSAGIDHVSVADYAQRLDQELEGLERVLREGTYRTQMLLRKYIPKEGRQGQRPLSIPTVRDRVVHTATKQVIEPIFEQTFHESSYGFRPQRSNKDALRRVSEGLEQGNLHVVDADISKCFDTIPHKQLLERIREKISDTRLLNLLEAFLSQGVMEADSEWSPEEGTPQGGPLSPLLANIYLNSLDWVLAQHGYTSIRFADDVVVLCSTREQAEEALGVLGGWMEANGLHLNPRKTRLVNMVEPKAHFDFLGYRFYRTANSKRLRWFARPQSVQKLRHKIRPMTKRCSGKSLWAIIQSLNPILRGWFEYFKHSINSVLCAVDGWIRMRLRSILRKRHKGKGRGQGRDHQRWPNSYFRDLGLFSLLAAKESLGPSARR